MSLDPHAVAAFAVTAGALFLFTRDRVPIERSCLAVLVVLVVGFELFPYDESDGVARLRGTHFLRAFGNEALVTICLLLIVAKGLEISGALRPVGRLLIGIWSRNRRLALLYTLILTALISAFVNNTPLVVMMMPILIGVAHRVGMSPSRILMPFCFAATIGGMTTTIGSSTNLLVVDVSADLGLPRIGMFDFVLPAAVAAGIGILYLGLVAPRWLRDRPSALEGTAPRIFYAVIELNDDSPFAGRTLGDLVRFAGDGIRIERFQRGGLEIVRLPSLTLRPGDKVHVRGPPQAIKQVELGVAGESAAGAASDAGRLRRGPDQRLIEIVVTRTSPLNGKRLSDLRRTTLGKLFPVGIRRAGPIRMMPIEEAGDPVLSIGDVLLMQGDARDIHELRSAHDYLILDRAIPVPRTGRALLATTIAAGVVLAAGSGVMPVLASALCGVGLLVFTRCLGWDEAWAAIDKRLVLVIVTSLALGTALSETGAAAYLARGYVAATEGLPAAVVLSGFLLLVALLNEVVSNNAVAVIATPIAVGIASQLGVPALPFVLAVLFGANAGFVTPIGYQTNLLVFTAGGYRFSDFLRVGLPLQLLTWAALSILLPVFYL